MSKQSRARIVIIVGILFVALSAFISLTRAPSAPPRTGMIEQPSGV